ncbi:MAG: hypothetical protein ACK40E_01290 [Caldimicrobium sp.]
MRCPKCSYFFSEELRTCPRCGQDMGLVIEKLGLFPPSSKKPLLEIEDFFEKEETNIQQERLIPFTYSQ